jgi:hypothetical protein
MAGAGVWELLISFSGNLLPGVCSEQYLWYQTRELTLRGRVTEQAYLHRSIP